MRCLLCAVVAIYTIATVFTVITSGTVVAAATIIAVGAVSTPCAVYIMVSRCSKSVKSSENIECTNAKVAIAWFVVSKDEEALCVQSATSSAGS